MRTRIFKIITAGQAGARMRQVFTLRAMQTPGPQQEWSPLKFCILSATPAPPNPSPAARIKRKKVKKVLKQCLAHTKMLDNIYSDTMVITQCYLSFLLFYCYYQSNLMVTSPPLFIKMKISVQRKCSCAKCNRFNLAILSSIYSFGDTECLWYVGIMLFTGDRE